MGEAGPSAAASVIDVHSWRCAPDDPLDAWTALLSDSERTRAARFSRPELGRRFITAHAQLRLILGRRLGRPPGALAFVTERSGKPKLADGACAFNLSHSGDVGVLAASAAGPVGVDVELIARAERSGPLGVMSAAERAIVAAAPPGLQGREALRLWTGKEAFAKALGTGLAAPLSAIQFAADPGGRLKLAHAPPDAGDPAAWRVEWFHPYEDAIAAVAVRADPPPAFRFRS